MVEDVAGFLDGEGDAGLVGWERIEEGVEAGGEGGLGEEGVRGAEEEG